MKINRLLLLLLLPFALSCFLITGCSKPLDDIRVKFATVNATNDMTLDVVIQQMHLNDEPLLAGEGTRYRYLDPTNFAYAITTTSGNGRVDTLRNGGLSFVASRYSLFLYDSLLPGIDIPRVKSYLINDDPFYNSDSAKIGTPVRLLHINSTVDKVLCLITDTLQKDTLFIDTLFYSQSYKIAYLKPACYTVSYFQIGKGFSPIATEPRATIVANTNYDIFQSAIGSNSDTRKSNKPSLSILRRY